MPNMFMKFEGPAIQGESVDPFHMNEIDVTSFSAGVSQPASALSGKVENPVFSDFTFTHDFDKASTALFLHCASGVKIDSGVLQVASEAEPSKFVLEYEFHDVIISNVAVNGSPEGEPAIAEAVAIKFAKLIIRYTAPDSSKTDAEWELSKVVKK